MTKICIPALVPALLAFVLGAACAHDPYEGRVYRAGPVAFRSGAIPASWDRVRDVDGPLLAFRDREGGAMIDVYARCGRDADDVPLAALTMHLLIGFTERDIREQTVSPMDGREAMHTVARAKLDGVPVELGIYVLKKDGCVYDLVFASRPDLYAAQVREFDAFAHDFATVRE